MELYQHQKQIVEQSIPILLTNKIVYLVMEVRTGKTLTSLNIANDFKHVIFITTKKAIPSIKDDYCQGNFSFTIEVVNYESAHKANHKEADLYVLDEAHKLGQFPKLSKRAKDLKNLINSKHCVLLSGTPTPESYSQIFHQLYVTGNSPFEESGFYSWAKTYVDKKQKMIKGVLMNDYSRAKKELIDEKISHLLVSCTQQESGFISNVEELFVSIKSNNLAKHMYEKIVKDKIYKGTNITILADSPAAEIIKLAQIASGTVIPEDSELGIIIDDSKIQYIKNNYTEKRIAIYYRFQAEYKLLSQSFNHTTDWQLFERQEYDIFISQIQSGREGISLKSADYLIMYNIDFSATSYWQVRARLQARNKAETSHIHWLFSDLGIEEKIYHAVSRKKNFTANYYKKLNNVREQDPKKIHKKNGESWLSGVENNSVQQKRIPGYSSNEKRNSQICRDEKNRDKERRTTSVIPARSTTCTWL